MIDLGKWIEQRRKKPFRKTGKIVMPSGKYYLYALRAIPRGCMGGGGPMTGAGEGRDK